MEFTIYKSDVLNPLLGNFFQGVKEEFIEPATIFGNAIEDKRHKRKNDMQREIINCMSYWGQDKELNDIFGENAEVIWRLSFVPYSTLLGNVSDFSKDHNPLRNISAKDLLEFLNTSDRQEISLELLYLIMRDS